MRKLTIRQNAVLEAITHYTYERKYPPSIRDLCGLLRVKSTQTIHKHLEILRSYGLVDWEEGKPRTLVVIRKLE